MNVHPEAGEFCGGKVLRFGPFSALLNRRIGPKQPREVQHRRVRRFADEVSTPRSWRCCAWVQRDRS
jgi:hypothetical protein